jgi:hypothetical protein
VTERIGSNRRGGNTWMIIWMFSLMSVKRYCADGDEHVGSIILGRIPSVWSNNFIYMQFTVRLINRQWDTCFTYGKLARTDRYAGIMDVKQKQRNGT